MSDYKRKTIDRWKAEVYMIVGFVIGMLLMSLGFYVNDWLREHYKQEFLSPLSDTQIRVIYPVLATPEPTPYNLEGDVRQVFGKQADNALKIFECESRMDIQAINYNRNGSVDNGLAQINSIHGVARKWLVNPEVSIRIAKMIYDERGNWSAWTCANKLGIY